MPDLTGHHVKYILDNPSINAGEIRHAIVLNQRDSKTVNLMVLIESDDFKHSGRVKNVTFNDDNEPELQTVGRVVAAESPEQSTVYYVNHVPYGTEYGHWFDEE